MKVSLDLAQATAEVRRLMAGGDVHGALRYLNSLTPHRFTGMYRFAHDTVASILGVDKSDPSVQKLSDVPVSASYCALTGRMGKPFNFPDALEEEMLMEHLSRQDVRSYCGVPLRGEDGMVYGTFCHWDFDATPVSDEMVELMVAVSEILAARTPAGRRTTQASTP